MRKVLTNSKNNNLIRYLDLMLVFMVNQMSNQLTLHAMKCQPGMSSTKASEFAACEKTFRKFFVVDAFLRF